MEAALKEFHKNEQTAVEDSRNCLLCRYLNDSTKMDNTAKENNHDRLSSAKSGKSMTNPSGIKSVTISETIHSPQNLPGNNRKLGTLEVEATERNGKEMEELPGVEDMLDYEQISVLRGKANTPVSQYTEFTELKDLDDTRSSV